MPAIEEILHNTRRKFLVAAQLLDLLIYSGTVGY